MKVGLVDETHALQLVSSIRNHYEEETKKRKLRLSSLDTHPVEQREAKESVENEQTSLISDAAHSNVAGLHALNSRLLPHPQTTMEVLTPIQSSTIEEKKKENFSTINLAEFESYSTNPFEEMELKTLNDKEELAMLLQPTTQPCYGVQQQQQFNPPVMAWPERTPQTYPLVRQYESTTDWIPNENYYFNIEKLSLGNSSVVEIQNQAVSRGNLRQAKSVPDLSDVTYGTGINPVQSAINSGSVPSEKRLSSRTPPPRFTADSITRPLPKPVINSFSPWEEKLNSTEKRLVQQLQDMGFQRERSARAILRLGVNEKDVVDQLLLIQKCEDEGHPIGRIQCALEVLKSSKDLPLLLPKHLALVKQLSALGFDQEKISSALVAAGHDRDKALDILLMK